MKLAVVNCPGHQDFCKEQTRFSFFSEIVFFFDAFVTIFDQQKRMGTEFEILNKIVTKLLLNRSDLNQNVVETKLILENLEHEYVSLNINTKSTIDEIKNKFLNETKNV